ncbi:MAG TPA: ABC transporter permease [Kiritimatiellia bacterium]|nr:ABC transporter permease [Kiritimatiellia bacterium]HMO98699.1 ABC transporter permease [Kiritimatiellia bacterium]HMP90886.1 ABC transporter permease [Kiritimatiellia bacterium]
MNQPSSSESWDLVIEPKRRWFELHLRDLWRYRDLVRMFVWRDFTAQYKQTILGPLWHIIQPLLTTITFTIIFGRVAKLPTDGLPPFLFYMTGNVVWAYFATCLTATSNTFIGNAHIFGKVYFPRVAVPVSVVISRLIGFAIQFSFYLAFLAWFAWRGADIQINRMVLLTPFLLVLMAGLGLGFGVLISSLTTRYRDLQQLVGFGVQLAMYATPVVYPLSLVGENYRWIVLANPMTPIVETFRHAFLGAGTVSPWHLAYSTAFTVILFIGGLALFNRVEKTFMDTV